MVEELAGAPFSDRENARRWAEAAALDTTRELADVLAGSFPQTVAYDFIYFIHGLGPAVEATRTYEPISALDLGVSVGEAVAEHFPGSRTICVECATSSRSPEALLQAVEQNRQLALELMGRPNVHDASRRLSDWDALVAGILVGAVQNGLPEDVRVIPIDAWNDAGIQQMLARSVSQMPISDVQRIRTGADIMRAREALCITQLHNIGMELARDGIPHEIAVIQGLGHDLTAAAVAELGAGKVSRLRLYEPSYMSPETIAKRRVRTTPGGVPESTLRLYAEANLIGVECAEELNLTDRENGLAWRAFMIANTALRLMLGSSEASRGDVHGFDAMRTATVGSTSRRQLARDWMRSQFDFNPLSYNDGEIFTPDM